MTPYEMGIALKNSIITLREKESAIEKILLMRGFKEVMLPLLYELANSENFGGDYSEELLRTVDPFRGRTLLIRGDFTPIFVSNVIPRIKGKREVDEKAFYRGEIVRVDPVRRELIWDYQVGAEWIGDVNNKETLDVVCEISNSILKEYVIVLNHIRIMEKFFKKQGIDLNSVRSVLLKRDISYFKDKLKRPAYHIIKELLTGIGGRETLITLKEQMRGFGCLREIEEIEGVVDGISKKWGEERWKVDFGNMSDFRYHRGLFFEVLSPSGVFIRGGRYDELFKRFGCDIKAIGFGIYLLEFFRK